MRGSRSSEREDFALGAVHAVHDRIYGHFIHADRIVVIGRDLIEIEGFGFGFVFVGRGAAVGIARHAHHIFLRAFNGAPTHVAAVYVQPVDLLAHFELFLDGISLIAPGEGYLHRVDAFRNFRLIDLHAVIADGRLDKRSVHFDFNGHAAFERRSHGLIDHGDRAVAQRPDRIVEIIVQPIFKLDSGNAQRHRIRPFTGDSGFARGIVDAERNLHFRARVGDHHVAELIVRKIAHGDHGEAAARRTVIFGAVIFAAEVKGDRRALCDVVVEDEIRLVGKLKRDRGLGVLLVGRAVSELDRARSIARHIAVLGDRGDDISHAVLKLRAAQKLFDVQLYRPHVVDAALISHGHGRIVRGESDVDGGRSRVDINRVAVELNLGLGDKAASDHDSERFTELGDQLARSRGELDAVRARGERGSVQLEPHRRIFGIVVVNGRRCGGDRLILAVVNRHNVILGSRHGRPVEHVVALLLHVGHAGRYGFFARSQQADGNNGDDQYQNGNFQYLFHVLLLSKFFFDPKLCFVLIYKL